MIDRDAGWTGLTLHEDIVLVAHGAMPALPEDLEAEVASVWAAERVRHPSLFNGRVFCAETITSDRIAGHWTEYRRVLAQIRRPALFDRLRIKALAVNGLLDCAEGLVLGQRQADAVYLPGFWQAAPAGNVEFRNDGTGLDLADQLLAELDEELGLVAADLLDLRPVVAIEHAGTHVVDVGFLLRSALPFATIEARWTATGNNEYDALRLVSRHAVPDVLAQDGPTLLPSARILMRRWSGLA